MNYKRIKTHINELHNEEDVSNYISYIHQNYHHHYAMYASYCAENWYIKKHNKPIYTIHPDAASWLHCIKDVMAITYVMNDVLYVESGSCILQLHVTDMPDGVYNIVGNELNQSMIYDFSSKGHGRIFFKTTKSKVTEFHIPSMQSKRYQPFNIVGSRIFPAYSTPDSEYDLLTIHRLMQYTRWYNNYKWYIVKDKHLILDYQYKGMKALIRNTDGINFVKNQRHTA